MKYRSTIIPSILSISITFAVIIFCIVFCNIVFISFVWAANDFVLSPAKIEISLDPGEKIEKELLITNRIGRTMKFIVGLEDVEGSLSGENPSVLMGESKGLYSLKDFLSPSVLEFVLDNGEQMIVPVGIFIPGGAEPGGLYGAVLVSAVLPEQGNAEDGSAQVQVLSRIAALFFVEVKGASNKAGILESFNIESKRENGQISFSILFKNTGDVHLNPYGIIRITDIFGREVDVIEVDPYFALPNSLRHREIVWQDSRPFGWFKASLSINRGYEDIIDMAEASFWIFSWTTAAVIGLIVVVLLILLLIVLAKSFIKKSQSQSQSQSQNNAV